MHSMRISGLFNKSRGGRATAVVLAARTVAMLFCLALVAPARGAERPNVLWITSEDNSPYLGCYGDPLAATPNLDRLASEGVRYRNAFANAPVCSTARTTLITGMYACSLGAQHHRSRVAIPAKFQLYPELLRAAGYYCTNNAKTDYNLPDRRNVWDENGRDAHYRHRAQGQPFLLCSRASATSQVAGRQDTSGARRSRKDSMAPVSSRHNNHSTRLGKLPRPHDADG